jgi:hypothetical protein
MARLLHRHVSSFQTYRRSVLDHSVKGLKLAFARIAVLTDMYIGGDDFVGHIHRLTELRVLHCYQLYKQRQAS